jgi:uncharacterized protein (DUF488 family)
VGDAREILTVGHSTHPIDRFLGLLAGAEVRAIADVRRFPGSRRNPQFGAEAVAASLGEAGIEYVPMGEELGGRRATRRAEREASPNAGWRNDSFRAYADHMRTPEFREGIERLEQVGRMKRTAVMCAEAAWQRCHRQLIADALLARGWSVTHLLSDGRVEPHRLTGFAIIDGDRLTYPPPQPTLELDDGIWPP